MSDTEILTWTGRRGKPLKTSFTLTGKGAPVVLIHGVGMNYSFWAPQIADLAGEYSVLAYDMLGHGSSSTPPADATLTDYAEQLLQLLDNLHFEHVHLAGHSMGALVALEFALLHPDRLQSVTALNAVYCRSPEQRAAVENRADALETMQNWDGSIDQTIARWFGLPVPSHLTQVSEWVRQALRSVDAVGYARSYRLFATSDNRHCGELKSLQIPALFMTGDGDLNSTASMSRQMALEVPIGRCEIIAGERHMMTLTAPAEVNRRMKTFFAMAADQKSIERTVAKSNS